MESSVEKRDQLLCVSKADNFEEKNIRFVTQPEVNINLLTNTPKSRNSCTNRIKLIVRQWLPALAGKFSIDIIV